MFKFPWISVNDKLPDHNRTVVIRHEQYKTQPVLGQYNALMNSWHVHPFGLSCRNSTNVTHWMEIVMPEIKKEEK